MNTLLESYKFPKIQSETSCGRAEYIVRNL